jgi:hypothetical protein
MVVRVFAVAALAIAAGLTFASQDASAHGRGRYDEPPIVVVPPGYRVQPHPYWYYGRPEPRYYAPPVILAPAPRYHERPHRRHYSRPGVTFEFRF